MKRLITLLCIIAVAICGCATNKITTKVPAEAFPAGHNTPEGAACDLARAFIQHDAVLFTNTCLPSFGGGENRVNYKQFLDGTTAAILAEATKTEPSPGGPRAITKVFAARHLSLDGPASYGFAVCGFTDVMFVDVEAVLYNGQCFLNRTLVVQLSNGKWFVHPVPELDKLLSAGLNDESDSTQEYSSKK